MYSLREALHQTLSQKPQQSTWLSYIYYTYILAAAAKRIGFFLCLEATTKTLSSYSPDFLLDLGSFFKRKISAFLKNLKAKSCIIYVYPIWMVETTPTKKTRNLSIVVLCLD